MYSIQKIKHRIQIEPLVLMLISTFLFLNLHTNPNISYLHVLKLLELNMDVIV